MLCFDKNTVTALFVRCYAWKEVSLRFQRCFANELLIHGFRFENISPNAVQRLMCRSAIGRQGEILSSHTFELDFIRRRPHKDEFPHAKL